MRVLGEEGTVIHLGPLPQQWKAPGLAYTEQPGRRVSWHPVGLASLPSPHP